MRDPMTPLPALAALAADMTAWRRDIHAHPELSGQESRTAKLVFDVLEGLGLKPEGGIGGEGVVAVDGLVVLGIGSKGESR
jgi:hippurate hydrolase